MDSDTTTANFPKTRQLYTTALKEWQIRLLRILPGQLEDHITGELVLAAPLMGNNGVVIEGHFNDKVQYSAFSYAWGEPVYNFPITINGSDISVTESLNQALQHLRLPDQELLLWADELCINQQDNEEKSAQVQKMIDVFAGASKVIVWLGCETKQTASVTQYVSLPMATHGMKWMDKRTNSQPEERQSLAAKHGVNRLRSTITPNNMQELCESLKDWCTRPWVRRAWVRQEVFAAKEVEIRCGCTVISLEWLKEFAFALKELAARSITNLDEEGEICVELLVSIVRCTPALKRQLTTLRMSGQGATCHCGPGNLRDSLEANVNVGTRPDCVLSKSRNLLASDPRDHVYAMLGLMDCNTQRTMEIDNVDPTNLVLPIDYSRSPSQVFQDLTKYIIKRDRSFAVLIESPESPSLENDLDLPSWCPDWRTYWHQYTGHTSEYHVDIDLISAEGALCFGGSVIAVSDSSLHRTSSLCCATLHAYSV
jgi:hypothetical protein